MQTKNERVLGALAFVSMAWLVGACASDAAPSEPTTATTAVTGAGSQTASTTGSAGAASVTSAGTGGSAGSGGAGGNAGAAGSGSGTAGTGTGSGGTGGSGAADAGDGAAGTSGDSGSADAITSTDSGLTDPGTEGDGRFPMMRPAIPPEAQGRLAGVTAGMMRSFQVPAAMGYAGRSGQVYVPAGYVAGTPIAFMLCHDGTSLDGSEKLTIVADNLAFQKKIPKMAFIFVPPSDRSREYDTVNDNFTKYLTTQALPAVEALNIKLTTDPEASGTCGHSSGGILAFTMAWFEPERYRRVLSFSGSFTSLQNPGGDLYDMLLRTTMPLKPVRTAMTAGTNDLLAPRWTQANEKMGAALMAAGYHYRYILINGGTHDQASSLPWVTELMTWLWRGYPISGPTR